jgi:hypothetical protein
MSLDSITTADANAALDTMYTTGGNTWIQLHTGFPGAAGTSNVATNNTRVQVTWSAAASGVKTSSADASWTAVSTTETYSHFSIWSAVTSGTFHGSGAVTSGSVTAGNDFKIASGSLTMTSTVAA